MRSFQVYERKGMSNILRKQLENRIMIRILLAEKDFQVQTKWQDFDHFLSGSSNSVYRSIITQ